jgi:hypothetical protein
MGGMRARASRTIGDKISEVYSNSDNNIEVLRMIVATTNSWGTS